jgi:hypothetical protein
MEALFSTSDLPLSTEAFSKFQFLENIFERLPLASGSVQWIAFGSDSHFKVSNAYKEAIGSHIVSLSLNGCGKLAINLSIKCSFGF